MLLQRLGRSPAPDTEISVLAVVRQPRGVGVLCNRAVPCPGTRRPGCVPSGRIRVPPGLANIRSKILIWAADGQPCYIVRID
jgi:hypothetical protein